MSEPKKYCHWCQTYGESRPAQDVMDWDNNGMFVGICLEHKILRSVAYLQDQVKALEVLVSTMQRDGK